MAKIIGRTKIIGGDFFASGKLVKLTKTHQIIAPLASVNCDNDDDRYDIVGCGAAGQPATGPLRSATRL